MNILPITIAKSSEEAPNYRKGHLIAGHRAQSAEIVEAVIVPNGTEAGRPTVDLQIVLKDEAGNITGAAVILITGGLIQMLATAIKGVEDRE